MTDHSGKDRAGNNPSGRKTDHIDLAFQSRVERSEGDRRFEYEPLFSGHPSKEIIPPVRLAGKTLDVPIWVSSMTGGTELAGKINRNLARACREFGMGMGLGSCRPLLEREDHWDDFSVRDILGPDRPLFANLGIAQLEEIADRGAEDSILEMTRRLDADGLIIHINPLQEWLQPEGDRFRRSPYHTIKHFIETIDLPFIVKEVGQGMGEESLRALLKLPLAAVEFAALGGTNFARLEMMRGSEQRKQVYRRLASLGHSAEEMTERVNEQVLQQNGAIRCERIIASGGVRDFLDGYYLIEKITLPAIYGQASAFLKHARASYGDLEEYVHSQVEGLALAYAYLRVK